MFIKFPVWSSFNLNSLYNMFLFFIIWNFWNLLLTYFVSWCTLCVLNIKCDAMTICRWRCESRNSLGTKGSTLKTVDMYIFLSLRFKTQLGCFYFRSRPWPKISLLVHVLVGFDTIGFTNLFYKFNMGPAHFIFTGW